MRLPEVDLSHAVFTATQALVAVTAADGRILAANPALQAFTGRTREDLVGRYFWDVWVVPHDIERAQRAAGAALTVGMSFTDEGDWIRGDGTWRRVAMQNGVMLDTDGQPYAIACIAIDVTEDRLRRDTMEHRAVTDALTGTRNRGAMFEVLKALLDPADGVGCGLLFCDLDDFKAVNDEHGHAAGDRRLVEVATRLRDATRPDDVVARFGGDEFVILRPGTSRPSLRQLADDIEERMRIPSTTSGSIGVSIGVAVGMPGDDPDDVLTQADRSMYRVKADRRRVHRD